MKGSTPQEQATRVDMLPTGMTKFRVDRQFLGMDGYRQVFMDVIAISGADASRLADMAKADNDATWAAKRKTSYFNPSMP